MLNNLLMSFKYAFSGLINSIKTERNMRIHLFAAVTVILLLHRYDLTSGETALIAITITFVIVCEMFNTAIEKLADEVTEERKTNIKICKDTAAAAVLMSALCAVAVAGVILLDVQVISDFFAEYFTSPIKILVVVLYLIAGTAFIFLPERKKK